MGVPRPAPVDTAVAVLLAAASTTEAALGLIDGPPGSLAVVLAPLVALPLAWRQRWPRHVAAACFAAALLQAAAAPVSVAGAAMPLALLLATYTVSARSPGRSALIAGGLVLLATAGLVLLDPAPDAGDLVYATSLMGVGWLFGRGARLRSERAELLAERARWLEAEQEHAVLAERARIARELHDVVAHRVTAIVLQAAAAGRGGPAGLEQFRSVEQEARLALGELRQLLGVLRHDGGGPGLTPQPSLDRLDDLVQEQRRTGLDARLTVTGTPGDLPPGAGLAAYRVVQESLTNARRHGGACRADVSVTWEPAILRLEVRDDGEASAAATAPGSGLGLVGMRERLELHGGRLEAGPVDGGGWRVLAELPR